MLFKSLMGTQNLLLLRTCLSGQIKTDELGCYLGPPTHLPTAATLRLNTDQPSPRGLDHYQDSSIKRWRDLDPTEIVHADNNQTSGKSHEFLKRKFACCINAASLPAAPSDSRPLAKKNVNCALGLSREECLKARQLRAGQSSCRATLVGQLQASTTKDYIVYRLTI